MEAPLNSMGKTNGGEIRKLVRTKHSGVLIYIEKGPSGVRQEAQKMSDLCVDVCVGGIHRDILL